MGIEGMRETDVNIRNIETVYSGWLNNSTVYICYHTHTHIWDKYAAGLSACLSVGFAVTNISMDQ
jgi:hypothetical protein